MRRLVPLLLMTVLACAHKASDGPTVLKNETVMEDKAEVVYELAYAAKGHDAHPHVTRWAGTTVGALGEADDAAALGVAHHWLSTEST